MTKEDITEKFLYYATEHGHAIWQGNHQEANKMHEELQKLYKVAKEKNVPDIFSSFLTEEDANVRLWAATFTLKINPGIAEQELMNLSELKGITAISARTILKLWKQGLLDLL